MQPYNKFVYPAWKDLWVGITTPYHCASLALNDLFVNVFIGNNEEDQKYFYDIYR